MLSYSNITEYLNNTQNELNISRQNMVKNSFEIERISSIADSLSVSWYCNALPLHVYTNL